VRKTQRIKGGTHKKHAIDVVHISMLPSTIMYVIPRHRNLGTIEYRWLQETSQMVPSTPMGWWQRTSFISFQMPTFSELCVHDQEPSMLLVLNNLTHISQLLGLKKSIHEDEPGQHHLSSMV
jgi:hypothetical protein